MTEPSQTRRTGPRRGRVHRAGGWLLILVLNLALLAGLALVTLSGRDLTLPESVTSRIETRLNAEAPPDTGSVELGAISVTLDDGMVPRLTLRDVVLTNPEGEALARLGRVGVSFDPGQLLQRRIAPRILRLDGAELTLERDAEGRLNLSFGSGQGITGGPAAMLDWLDDLLARAPFDRVERVELREMGLTVEDRRAGRDYRVADGTLILRRDGEGIALSLLARLEGGAQPARARVTIRTHAMDSSAELAVEVSDVPARDIAQQSPALAFLGVLDAPISGAIRSRLDDDGALETVAGTLEIASGALLPTTRAEPVPFDSAKAYFTYDPGRDRLDFSEISVRSEAASLTVTGHAYLRDPGPGGWPGSLVAQVELSDLAVTQPALLRTPLSIGRGVADFKLRLDPFSVSLGQLVLIEDGAGAERRYVVDGRVAAAPEGWQAALNVTAATIPAARVQALWPVPVAAKTWGWLDKYLGGGTITDATAALRITPGQPPQLAADFKFSDVDVRFLKDMPPLTGGAGYGSLIDRRFVLVLDKGSVTAPQGGEIDLAGTTMVVPDVKQKPARGQFEVATTGSLTGLLSLLDRPPLEVMTKAGRPPDMADAVARFNTEMSLLFRKGNTPADIDYAARGTLGGLRSDQIVPGRDLRATELTVEATPSALVVAGDVTLDAIPLSVRWRQGMGPAEKGRSRLNGEIELSPRFLETFNIALPKGALSGRGSGEFTLDLRKGEAPRFSLASDLVGVGLRLDAMNWAKPAGQAGRLAVSGRLGKPPEISEVSLDAAGLQAEGRVNLAARGGLDTARFSRVRLGEWLDAAVTVTGRGKGVPPAIELTGGRADIRKADLGKAGGQAGAARGPLTLNLDRLILTDTIALRPFAASIAAGTQMNGRFQGRVNGGSLVSGALAPTATGTALRITAPDGGAILRDAGLFAKVQDGQLDLTLQPTGAPGTYDGSLTVLGPRIRGAPALADLLGAISVVGLIEQLNGRGIVFDEASADFRLSPGRVTVYKSSAVGASLGISMDGIYDLASKRMDMQGVVSPIYLINSIGSIFTRKGEGLFGFNFRLTGPATAPDVGVNPLSILTPGMFREIFRRPPPQRN